MLTIISCHTNSNIKIDALIHNIKYFFEISDTIAIINSLEFVHLNIEEKIKKVYVNKNIIFNDVISDELCYIYKKKYVDLQHFNNDELRNHWISYGKHEKRSFTFPVYNVYFDYKQNDKYISHGKWLYFLNKINYTIYKNIILTNDSFLITRPLTNLISLVDENTELVSLLNSNQSKQHYPDFLRIYNLIGLNKIIDYFNKNMHKITNFKSIIDEFEINSSCIFQNVKVLYKMNTSYFGNILFDDEYLENYLFHKNYPVVKIKKILSTLYVDKHIPNDFNSNEYKSLNPDLEQLSDKDALNHFIIHGINEGRLYKKNQKTQRPIYLEMYLNLIGFKL